MSEEQEILVVAPAPYIDFAGELVEKITTYPGCKSALVTAQQYEHQKFQLSENQLAILIGSADENPATNSALPSIHNLRNEAGACFGFDRTTAVAFGEGKLDQREKFQPVLDRCGKILAGAQGFSKFGVDLAAACIIFTPKNVVMPALMKVAEKLRHKEWEQRLRAEQTKAALTLFLAEHAHTWAGLQKNRE